MTPSVSKSGKPLTIFGTPEERAVEQINAVLADERAVAGALMADNHVGYSMPIGGVVAYDGAVSPTGVGFDIGCGNMAVKTDLNLNDWAPWALDEEFNGAFSSIFYDDLKKVMREIQKKVAFGLGRSNPDPIDHDLFDNPVWLWLESVKPGLKQKAQEQLGTVGSGNHYVDLLVDTSGHVWIANHFGSRGLGHTIASGFFALDAGLSFGDRVPETDESVVFETDSEIGAHYLACMELAGQYAYAGREYVIDQVLGILGAKDVETVHNHHNYAWLEDGLWVVRKGATPLTTQSAFIGGSMGDISVIVRGKAAGYYNLSDADDPMQTAPTYIGAGNEPFGHVYDIGNIGSAPHGAGRVMSRTKAAGKMRKALYCGLCRHTEFSGDLFAGESCPRCGKGALRKTRMRDKSTAAIDWDAARAELTARGIVVLGAGADESPGVYKNLATVLSAHSNIEVLETLQPLGVVMASPDEYDPFKE